MSAVRPANCKQQKLIWRRLVFLCVKKNKIYSSSSAEMYTTFQELVRYQRYVVDERQKSDLWFAEKLQKHYSVINRHSQSLARQLLQLETIGFASFIRVRVSFLVVKRHF